MYDICLSTYNVSITISKLSIPDWTVIDELLSCSHVIKLTDIKPNIQKCCLALFCAEHKA